MDNDQNRFPIWLGGVLLALILILISTRGGGVNTPALVHQFAPQPTDPLAPTPVASGPRVRVEVQEVRRVGDRVRVTGHVANLSNAPLTLPASAFSFRD